MFCSSNAFTVSVPHVYKFLKEFLTFGEAFFLFLDYLHNIPPSVIEVVFFILLDRLSSILFFGDGQLSD